MSIFYHGGILLQLAFRSHRFYVYAIIVLLCSAGCSGLLPSGGTEEISYLEQVQPILATKCYPCHGPDEAKREAGLRLDSREAYFQVLESGNTAVHKGRWSDSHLIKRILSEDGEVKMPPPDFPKQLDADEIAILKDWVEAGVPWENHWSYEPIEKVEPPQVDEPAWNVNPIDRFVLSAQLSRGLSHAEPADRRTLIRRLTYDLHGLPPTPDEVQAFVDDKSEHAYESLVEDLLASPHYGERWARHWLDVVHYGETHGYDKDKRRPNAWPYRDYVINAFNNDIPYGRFVEDQIAGDVMYPEDPQSTVAVGFLAAGPWDFVGHAELREGTVDKRIVRNLDRDDIVTNAISTFTGLTVQCARCHDHKFDPIRQTDYYSLQAVFAGIERADRPYDSDSDLHFKRVTLRERRGHLDDGLKELGMQMDSSSVAELSNLLAEKEKLERKIAVLKRPASAHFGFHSRVEQKANLQKWVVIDLGKIHRLNKIVLTPARPTEGIAMPGYGFPLRFKLEISAKEDFSVSQTVLDFSREDHNERTDKSIEADFDLEGVRYVRFSAQKLWKGRGQDHFLALAELQAFRGDINVARGAKVTSSDALRNDRWNPQYMTDGFDSRVLIGGEVLPVESRKEVATKELELQDFVEKENIIRRKSLDERERQRLDSIQSLIVGLEDSLAELPAPEYVYAAATTFRPVGTFAPFDSIRPIPLLHRGDTEQPGKLMVPGTVATFEGLADRFDLPDSHNEGDRRAALARWMTDPLNAFTWRSIVNRLWQYHFGAGIVTTPNDFGKMGTPPSHPELLDYLAQELLENGQSLKWLHRLIVTSQTYKQSSLSNVGNEKIDGSNKYLWRANRRQLEAEAVRDGVLAASGKLDLTMGGPGFDAFRYEDDHSPRYIYKDYDPFDPSSFRRSIYRFIVRSEPDPFMSTMDCADPSQSVPVRDETVTALQALSALNNPFMVRQADFLARRLSSETGDLRSQLALAFTYTLQRSAGEVEISELETYAEKHGLSSACRLIFAMNEFLYLD